MIHQNIYQPLTKEAPYAVNLNHLGGRLTDRSVHLLVRKY
jgi:integrase/recombinase XerC